MTPLQLYQPPTSDEAKGDDRIAVIIPVYNRKTILLETLEHVLAQTRLPDRLLIVDDGSSDGTADASEAWLLDRRPAFRWEVIRGPRRSAAAARREGTRRLDDETLVAFLDSDDHWPADFLQRTAAVLTGDPSAVAVSTDRRYLDASGCGDQRCDCAALAADPIPWFFLHGAGVASCSLLRVEAVRAAGGWRPELKTAEDVWLFVHASLLGRWLHAPGDPVTFHLGNAAARNEASNLSRKHAMLDAGWAAVYERLYHQVCERRPGIDRGVLHAALAERWRRAGKQQLRGGLPALAKRSLRRSIHWSPVQITAWRRLAVASLRAG